MYISITEDTVQYELVKSGRARRLPRIIVTLLRILFTNFIFILTIKFKYFFFFFTYIYFSVFYDSLTVNRVKLFLLSIFNIVSLSGNGVYIFGKYIVFIGFA